MDALNSVADRSECPQCHRKVKFFCYHCVWLVPELEGKLPQVDLPVPLTVLMDHRELSGKSTAIHARFLTRPQQCHIHKVDPKGRPEHIRALLDELARDGNVALLFPDSAAATSDAVDWSSIRQVVAIDGTWSQAKAINRVLKNADPGLKGRITWVQLRGGASTRFWRYQSLGPHCLSTIEAIKELYAEAFPGPQFDGLLCMFDFFYELIQRDYHEHPDRPFTSRHRSGYLVRDSVGMHERHDGSE